jgi:hypothetical protein
MLVWKLAGTMPADPSNSCPNLISAVITGFNTDIEFDGIVYHVQTEDKGLERPFILSLVYDGGTILASKRQPYDDLIASGFDENTLADRLNRQHSLICAAVTTGRLEDLKRMGERGGERNPTAADGEPAKKISAAETITEDELTELVLPEEAVEIISDLGGRERASHSKLNIEILGESRFKGGEQHTLCFMVCRGSERKVVSEAEILVKILGSTFRPQIFHASTDANGLASLSLKLPSFRSGRAAFYVRAMSNGDAIEVRRPIAHG